MDGREESIKIEKTKSFSGLHFKMNLPVIKVFADRIEATSRFSYSHIDDDIDTILEKCVITDRFGSEFTSHEDYIVLKHGKSKTIGKFSCKGYDTFGPFKLVGGVAKGHPNEKDLAEAVDFYQGLCRKNMGEVSRCHLI